MKQRRVAGILRIFFLAVVTAAGSGVAARADTISVETYEADWVAYNGFIIGTPLNAADQHYVEQFTANVYRTHPQIVTPQHRDIQNVLAQVRADPLHADERREELRLFVARQSDENRAWREFVEARDPTIVFVPEKQQLVTERSLVTLRRACAFFTKTLYVAAPDAGFITRERAYLRTHFKTLPESEKYAAGHVGRDIAVMTDPGQKTDPGKNAALVKAVRPYFQSQNQYAASTIAVLGPIDDRIAAALLRRNIVMHSLILNGAMNYNMLQTMDYNSNWGGWAAAHRNVIPMPHPQF